MKPFIVVADGFDKKLFEQLCDNPSLEVHPQSKVSQDELAKLLPKVQGLVIRSATQVDVDLLEKAPQLKLVIRAGEGTDNIDKKSCHTKGVTVENTPGANNNSAAEHAIALILSTLRHIPQAHRSMNEGRWDKALYMGNELSHKKVGIVGFGRIGQIVAKRLAGFEVDVLFYDPFVEKSDLPYASKAQDLKQVFAESDIVTLHVPLNEHTKNLVTAELIQSMKPGAILVNASRGKIADEHALQKALEEQSLKAAAFDVFANEPLDESSPLRSIPQLITTPHLGASTAEAQVRVGQMVLEQLDQFFTHTKIINEVKA